MKMKFPFKLGIGTNADDTLIGTDLSEIFLGLMGTTAFLPVEV